MNGDENGLPESVELGERDFRRGILVHSTTMSKGGPARVPIYVCLCTCVQVCVSVNYYLITRDNVESIARDGTFDELVGRKKSGIPTRHESPFHRDTTWPASRERLSIIDNGDNKSPPDAFPSRDVP